MEKLRNSVKEYLKEISLEEGTKIVLALSGGSDSVALFHVLVSLKDTYNFRLEAVHVNHGLRENATVDEKFVQELCSGYDIPLKVVSVSVKDYVKKTGVSVEEGARILRYQAFEENTEEGNYIALAHHGNDQVETMLFHMARGTGLKGAIGMPGRRGKYLRPFLHVPKEWILSALKEGNYSWREDESNEDLTYARNRIRKEVLPALHQVNDKAVEHFLSLSEDFEEIENYLEEVEEKAYKRCVRDGILWKESFLVEAPLIQKRILLRYIASFTGKKKDLGREHIEAIRNLLNLQVGRKLDLPYGVQFYRTYEGISGKKREEEVGTLSLELIEVLKEQATTLKKEIEHLPKDSYITYFDQEKLGEMPTVSLREEEMKMETKTGEHQSLKKIFVNEKVPSEKREKLPLLTIGKEVLWIPGVRRSAKAYVTEETRLVLVVRYSEKLW